MTAPNANKAGKLKTLRAEKEPLTFDMAINEPNDLTQLASSLMDPVFIATFDLKEIVGDIQGRK